jgi:DNA-binding XRE family transcriptional regulator
MGKGLYKLAQPFSDRCRSRPMHEHDEKRLATNAKICNKNRCNINELLSGPGPYIFVMETMTPERLQECLNVLAWSQTDLADRLGVSPRTTRSWCNGRRVVPDNVALWISDIALRVQQKPEGWQRDS